MLDLSLAEALSWVLILFAGGFVKGVIGFAMPMVTVPLMSMVFSVPFAVSTLIVPMFVLNVAQMYRAGPPWPIFRRHWRLLVALLIGVTIGSRILAEAEPSDVFRILGTLVVTFAVLNLIGVKLNIPDRWEHRAGPLAGLIAGVTGGFSGIWGPPLVMFLIAIRVTPIVMVASIGVFFLMANFALAGSLITFGLMGKAEIISTFLAVLPTYAGMHIGQKVADKISPALFRKVVLIFLVVIGISLLLR